VTEISSASSGERRNTIVAYQHISARGESGGINRVAKINSSGIGNGMKSGINCVSSASWRVWQ